MTASEARLHPAIAALALAAGLVPAPAAAEPAIPCKAGDRECYFKVMRAHPVKSEAFWKSRLAQPIDERLGPAPAELVEFVTMDNIAQGFSERPRPAHPAPEFMADLHGAIADLPPAVRRAFNDTFAGVWLVEDLGGTGFTDTYQDAGGKPIGGFILLDATVLSKFTANAWATWKENTPFRPAGGWTLEAKIEEPAGDDRRGAIRYILLHELGHVLSINRNVHPRWDMPPKAAHGGRHYPFFDLSWTLDTAKDRYVSKFESALPMRQDVVYYLKPKLAATAMERTYDGLLKTNYPSLYAATSPGDDFAESFVTYVHTVLLKRPWRITLRKDGQVMKSYGTCWEEPRCAPKRRMLEDLLK